MVVKTGKCERCRAGQQTGNSGWSCCFSLEAQFLLLQETVGFSPHKTMY